MSRRPLGTPLSFPLAPGDSGTETRAIWVGRYQLSRAECFFCFPLFFLIFSWFCFGDKVSLYIPGYLRTLHIDQAGLKLTKICLPLPPQCWD